MLSGVVGGGGGDRAQMARVSSPLARAQHTAAQPLTLLSPIAEHCTDLILYPVLHLYFARCTMYMLQISLALRDGLRCALL